MKHLKLWGPLRSGTNYLGRLLELNFEEIEVHHNEGGWKHGPPQETCYIERTIARRPHPYDGHLLIMKSPFAWINSLRHYSMMPEMKVEWYAHQWNQHAREIFAFSWHDDAFFLRYEDLLKHLELRLGEIRRMFNLVHASGYPPWVDERRRMLRGGDNMKGERAVSSTLMNPNFYLRHEYMRNFTSPEIEAVRLTIDPYLVRQLKYNHIYDQQIF